MWISTPRDYTDLLIYLSMASARRFPSNRVANGKHHRVRCSNVITVVDSANRGFIIRISRGQRKFPATVCDEKHVSSTGLSVDTHVLLVQAADGAFCTQLLLWRTVLPWPWPASRAIWRPRRLRGVVDEPSALTAATFTTSRIAARHSSRQRPMPGVRRRGITDRTRSASVIHVTFRQTVFLI